MEALRWAVVQGVASILTLLLGMAVALYAFYQYRQTLVRGRIKATSDAIVEAAAVDVAYSKHVRIPALEAADNGLHNLALVQELFAKEKSAAEQLALSDFWDTSTRVNNYFAESMALIEAKYLDEKLFFDRLDTFTSVAFLIVYPGFNWLCLQKGLGANVRSFRKAAMLARESLLRKNVDNGITRVPLDVEPYI
jgi:hypothetical protein